MLAGYPVGIVLEWCFQQFLNMCCAPSPLQPEVKTQPRSGGMGSIYRWLWRYVKPLTLPAEVADFFETSESLHRQFPRPCRATRCTVAMLILAAGYQNMRDPVKNFIATCEEIAPHMGHPSIVFKSRQGLITDYLDGYKWLKANTPSDARVMAWWDYGYQITGIGNRTSIADGNTWNHEHIATLGRTLTNPEKKAHNIMRHLADYVLVWAGGQGDDMGKSPHLARIANSVFPDVCGEDDPTCRKFGFYAGGQPTEMMAASFLYKAVRHNIDEGVRLDGKLFQEVHTTKHGLMRIFKVLGVSEESKKWVADPANRKCDAEGSWYCVGQYPPSLHKLISKRKNFAQLEDFNRKDGEKSAYTRMVAYAHFIRGVDNSCQLASAHSARRLPWVSAALAASCAGIYALVVQKQRWDREAQLMKEADEAELRRARMEAEAAAAATAEAEAQAAQAKAAREDAERIQKAAIAKESQEAQERARKDLERRHAEFAAVAGQCSQLLADLKLVVEATDYVEVAPHTEGLSEFMQQAQAFVDGESFKSLQESSLDGMAELTAQCAYALSAAKDHLAKLSKAQAAERLYEAAAAEMRAERQKWLLGEDVDAHALGSALGRAQDALSELRSCGLEMSLETIDGSQVSAAQSVLSELEEARQKEQGWEQNRQALQSAVAAQDAAACESALKEASSADCPLSAAMALAEEMSLPRQIDISEVAKGMQLAPLSEQSGEVDYVAAAAAASSFVSSSELSDQASSLAKEIATQYVLDKQELAHASQLLLPEWANQCSQKTAQLSRAFAGQKSKQKLQLIQDFQQTAADRRKQAIREAMGEVQDEVEKDIYSLQSAQMQALWAELAQVRGSFDDQLRSLGQAPERLQQLWSSDRSPDAQAKSASLSTLNLLALREASREEHAESTDAFASSVTARVRTELTALGKGSVKEIPTQQELQRSFHDELPKLVAAVFEPRTGLASSFVGRIFGMMYVLRSEQEEASTHAALESRLGQRIPTVAPEDGVHRQNQKNNLRTLALAMHLVDTGRLAEAVDTLDGSLRGPCRSLAHGWMSLARMSLLLQQVEEKMKREEAGISAGHEMLSGSENTKVSLELAQVADSVPERIRLQMLDGSEAPLPASVVSELLKPRHTWLVERVVGLRLAAWWQGWTCEYYRQQGLCGKLNGVVREIRQSARGRLHNWPEKNCCGCESQDDTSCNRQTGKSCALEFGFCGASRGPAYCHNLSTCLCLPGHCASTEGYCSLQVPVQEFATPSASPASTTCRDTPDWANGWSACAYEEGGRNSAWCKPTPGAVWPSTMGWTCAYYREKGLCKNRNISTWAMGKMHNYPERNCCGCHAVQNTTCNRNTGGLCSFGFCDPSRGPTVCVDGKCLCQEGHCGTTAGVCSLTVEAIEASLLTPEGVHEAAGQATKAGISAAEAARTAGKSAADDVNAAATAAGRAAIRAGLSREQAAEAAADAAGQAASEAKATPQQAGSAAADWVRKQEKSAGMPQDKQAHAAAKSAARAAAKAAKLIFLTEQQAAYAAQAAALEAGLDSGLSLQQA
ncbi:STT3B, partial [Symbiodinium sp. KB8]